jgi:hypothetical protein
VAWLAAAGAHSSLPNDWQLDHLYRVGLDAAPPDAIKPVSYMERMPAQLCCHEYPEHMKNKADEKNGRALQRASSSGAAGTRMVSLVESKESLLARLWHAVLCSSSGELSAIHVDPAGTPAFDNHYVELWKERYAEYARRERELRGKRGEGTLIEDDDPYWEQYRELIAEYSALLFQHHPQWERLMNPQEIYAEVAAIYEVCYKAAHYQLQQQRTLEGQREDVAAALVSASTAAPRQPGAGRIRFPWRIAQQQLLEMKEKARQLAQGDSLP